MKKEVDTLLKEYNELKELNLSFNLARGKPNKEQLDLSNGLLDIFDSGSNFTDEAGLDVRNYGEPTGIKEAKELFGAILDIDPDNIVLWGNSSLHGIFEFISKSYTHGVNDSTPWSKLDEVKWLCPVPGYDRHFKISEYFGMQMINIPMDENGPDMDMIEEYVKDPAVKGIWCVPIYSNPTGITYSDEVVRRFAKLKPAAKDFRIYWDCAYIVHHLYNGHNDKLLNLYKELEKNHNEDLVYIFASTSKITFAGSGIAAVASSQANIKHISAGLSMETICFDRLNQLRHVRFLKDLDNVNKHMQKHADIIRPKFEMVFKWLDKVKDIAWFTKPNGGYFVSIFVKEGTASKVIARCKECGLVLTDSGCAYPYHKDPKDSHIRLAPTYLEDNQIEPAMKILTFAIRIEYELSND